MIHVIHMIRRRYSDRAGTITRILFLTSGSMLLAGVGLLVLG